MKLLVLADLHIGTSRESSTHLGVIRQANTPAFDSLKSLIPKINNINPDLVMQMGDFIREVSDQQVNLDLTSQFIESLKKIQSNIINLVGNHDLEALSIETLEKLLLSEGQPKFYGFKDLGQFRIIWLDFILNDKVAYLPEGRLSWIAETLNTDKKVLIFSHYSLTSFNTKGNFYFEGNPEKVSFAHVSKEMDLIGEEKSVISFSAHAHWMGYKLDKIHQISLPSFSEHLLVSEHVDSSPQVYTLIEDIDNFLTIKSYSGDYCLLDIELPLN